MAEIFDLWEKNIPGTETEIPRITCYPPLQKATDAAVVIYPGGGYAMRADHEGEGYARMLNTFGITAFVVDYRVAPAHFPDELLDARRAVRFVRKNAEKFGIAKDKIAVMGSSAGGHLAALVSTYRGALDGENADKTDTEDYLPNAAILCYPVISSDESIAHIGSYRNFLGDRYGERAHYSPELIADEKTPQTFIWHTAADNAVHVENSYRYATTLCRLSVPCEMHIFPYGVHGIGICPDQPHAAQWTTLLRNWLTLIGFLPNRLS